MIDVTNELVVCTIFEGHYHYGVATLANSLYKQGFKGSIFAGYRGKLPSWAANAPVNPDINWKGATTLKVNADLQLHFLPLITNYHLTNYKPDFMLELWDGIASGAQSMFYFDPDIVISAPWFFFEKWVKCGVALCEDINSPLTKNHPTRIAWREYFGGLGFKLNFKDPIYVNGGFTGVHLKDRSFLETWKQIQEGMGAHIGGLSRSAFATGEQLSEDAQGPFAPFGKTDQDALNATVEAWNGELSFITQEGMGFRDGLTVMPHALGQPKPWNWQIFKQSLGGRAPRLVDTEYWKYAQGPIYTYSSAVIKRKKIAIAFAKLLGRFYRK
jgi:hypothetical protein